MRARTHAHAASANAWDILVMVTLFLHLCVGRGAVSISGAVSVLLHIGGVRYSTRHTTSNLMKTGRETRR